jgi:hypothetical protein
VKVRDPRGSGRKSIIDARCAALGVDPLDRGMSTASGCRSARGSKLGWLNYTGTSASADSSPVTSAACGAVERAPTSSKVDAPGPQRVARYPHHVATMSTRGGLPGQAAHLRQGEHLLPFPVPASRLGLGAGLSCLGTYGHLEQLTGAAPGQSLAAAIWQRGN